MKTIKETITSLKNQYHELYAMVWEQVYEQQGEILLAQNADESVYIQETRCKWDGEVAERYVGICIHDDELCAIRLDSGENGDRACYSGVGGTFVFNGIDSYNRYKWTSCISFERLFSEVSLEYSLKVIEAFVK